MKSYLRYEPGKLFGVIASPQCNVIYDWSGNLAISGTLQDISVWNLRQGIQISSLKYDLVNYPYASFGEISVLSRCADKSTLSAGYTTGEIRIFDYIAKTTKAVLRGHKSGVSCLTNDGGSILASGGKDSDIFLWDLTSCTGVCQLRGHKDVVTGLAFLPIPSSLEGTVTVNGTAVLSKRLVSCSKDTLMKVWDVETQTCLQTITGHRCEIWSLAISPSGSFLVTGSSDESIRGYRIRSGVEAQNSNSNDNNNAASELSPAPVVNLNDDEQVLDYIGCVHREHGNTDKCTGVHFSACGSVLAAQSSGKIVDLYRIRSDDERTKKAKRKAKRAREKETSSSKKTMTDSTDGGGDVHHVHVEEGVGVEGGDQMTITMTQTLTDYLEPIQSIRCTQKVRSLCFSPDTSIIHGSSSSSSNGKGKGKVVKAMISLMDNVIEVYDIPVVMSENSGNTSSDNVPGKTSVLELPGHRSDVRAVALSSDGLVLATCSSDGVKIWSTSSFLSNRSCRTGYGVSICFAPGNRYALVGTREGKIQAVDVSSGEMVLEVEAHEGAVWSLAVRPDGRGMMSGGADKMVKFWDFTVEGGKLGVSLSRELQMSQDVLCLRYSGSKSQSKLLLAVGLLDHTVKVFFDDSLKFFLSLYGHKLPVTCLDISTDSTLLASGSADKTVKIWGLDFGDCHRSLLGHEDTVTAVRWQSQSHLLFTASKDGVVKYWDAD
eukprot:gene6461-13054_t